MPLFVPMPVKPKFQPATLLVERQAHLSTSVVAIYYDISSGQPITECRKADRYGQNLQGCDLVVTALGKTIDQCLRRWAICVVTLTINAQDCRTPHIFKHVHAQAFCKRIIRKHTPWRHTSGVHPQVSWRSIRSRPRILFNDFAFQHIQPPYECNFQRRLHGRTTR